MIKLLFVVLYITFIVPCWSQRHPMPLSGMDISKYKVVDHSKFHVTYFLEFKYTPQKESYYSDIRIVQVGSKVVKDFSRTMNHGDSITTLHIKKGAKTLENLSPGKIYPYEIFNNYEKGKCLTTYRTFMQGPVLRYFDEQPIFVWELKNETEMILGYQCQLATTHFAGRDYKAWFARELPVNGGPYKFNGLPGFILKVEESNRFFVWTATGISNMNEPIVEYEIKNGYQNCTKTQAEDLIKKMFNSPMQFSLSLNPNSENYVINKDGSVTKAKIKDEKPIPYEPLEQ